MASYIIVSIISGILFGIMDGVINANPLAQRLYQAYKPIARTSLKPLPGIMIDLAYGFVMAGVFLLLYKSLPGETGLVRGISYALLVWFFRVVMATASQSCRAWLAGRPTRRGCVNRTSATKEALWNP